MAAMAAAAEGMMLKGCASYHTRHATFLQYLRDGLVLLLHQHLDTGLDSECFAIDSFFAKGRALG
jgi:hypothetical protein